ncbi:hypothetical protein BC826DRAFT_143742 [Russula brevipes]|nr:hypothetical protein BC826DRAFT_143742 [Russula brevipes]
MPAQVLGLEGIIEVATILMWEHETPFLGYCKFQASATDATLDVRALVTAWGRGINRSWAVKPKLSCHGGPDTLYALQSQRLKDLNSDVGCGSRQLSRVYDLYDNKDKKVHYYKTNPFQVDFRSTLYKVKKSEKSEIFLTVLLMSISPPRPLLYLSTFYSKPHTRPTV